MVKHNPKKNKIMERRKKTQTRRIVNLIIVDESGSMSLIERQALTGLNETLATVKRMQDNDPSVGQSVTLLTFNSDHTRYVFDNTPARHVHTIGSREYQPSGATPLYDAIGRGVSKVNAQTSASDVVLVTIITDGEENCSREYDLRMVKQLIEKMKLQRWTFTFIGTDNLDVRRMAHDMAIDNHMEFAEDAEGTQRMFEIDRHARMRFCSQAVHDERIPEGGYFDGLDDQRPARKRRGK